MFGKLKLKDWLKISMLIALTVVLGYISGFLRFGNISKISLGFIPVFIGAISYGAVAGGVIGASADILSYFFNPTGAFLWQLTLIEFAYGFIFGILFKRSADELKKGYFIRLIICTAIQFAVNLLVKTPVLMSVGYAPSDFSAAVLLRLPAVAFTMALQLVILGFSARFMPILLRFIRN